MLERLVTPERTRALVSMAELRSLNGEVDTVEHVVQHLAAMRLLVIERNEGSDCTVELVHESLIDRWPTLARWLTENQGDAAFLARLRSAAQAWEKHDREEGLLWRGASAHEVRLWYAHYRGVLAGREQDYLNAVFAVADRAVRVRRRTVGGILAFMALLLVGVTSALVQIRQAQREANRQAEIARAQAAEREQARGDAYVAKQAAEREADRARAALDDVARAHDQARAALAQAQAEKMKAEQSAKQEQRARDAAEQAAREAQQARDVAEAAQAQAQAEKARAEQTRDREQRARSEIQILLDKERARRKQFERMLGGTLRNPAASAPTPRTPHHPMDRKN